jgi:tetratricopeptide (TPR) repeat protein
MNSHSTKLSAFCDKVLEAGWLLAVIITPLFFNVYSSRVFEPDKLTTLRTLALVMGAVWVVKLIEDRTSGHRDIGINWRMPLVLPTLFMVVVYILSTLLSVTPYVSFFGSYQRLQGTYTTLAYIVVFLVVLQGLRTRAQLDRLITVVILNSLPIALYGLIQRNKLDPLPWGGDVTKRVASNMGNAIFVAAYLIMAALPTLARVLDAFRSILTEEEANAADIPRAAVYIFMFLVQVIAIWYTQSRGPLMGLLAGLGVWGLLNLLALQRIVSRRVWSFVWFGGLLLVVLVSLGFFLINPGGPLHEIAVAQPSLNRVARVLQYESGTGKVRNLIWEGALDLISPHEPIEYPPTDAYPEGRYDPYNALRPLIGYGPESMYVAYNPFYPPLLGHFESRTASPDRSHNETMDSLVITGLLGFVAYIWIFGSVFYYGLRWLGFLPNDWRRTLFFILLPVGALVASVLVIPTIGPHFIGLAIPVGMVGGLGLYLVIYGTSRFWLPDAAAEFHPYFITLTGLLAAVVAHFVEINFGIAIASTRTTFWAYAGAFVVAGLGLIREPGADLDEKAVATGDRRRQGSTRRRRRRKPASSSSAARASLPAWLWPTFAIAIVGGFVLGTLSFDFVTNAERLTEPVRIVWRALTVLPAQDSRTSYGALMIFGLTWLMGATVFISEMATDGAFQERNGDGWLAFVLYLLISLGVGFSYALVLASRQAALMNIQAQTLEDVIGIADKVASFLTSYYWFIVVVLIAIGGVLYLDSSRRPERSAQPWGVIALLALSVLVGAVAVRTNLRPIQADIVYKQADPYDRGKQWLVAIEHYKHALELVPYEDFYYLYLGRAYLEYASSLDDPTVRETVMRETEQTLYQAREVNPLNTDHSANLARMYRRWADFASDEETRRELLRKSAENYAIATMLSPQNAILWNEWTMLNYYGIGDMAEYERTLSISLELDPEFDQTWLVCGDTNRQQGNLEEAARCYEEALDLNPRSAQVWRMIGDTYIALQEWDKAIDALTMTVELQPNASDIWRIHQVLAQLYNQVGDNIQAVVYAQMALDLAPDDEKAQLEALKAQLEALVAE